MAINVKNGNVNQKILNSVIDTHLKDSHQKEKDTSLHKLKGDGSITFGAQKITFRQKVVAAILCLFLCQSTSIVLTISSRLLYEYHLINIKTCASMIVGAVIFGLITPIIFRVISIIGSRYNKKNINAINDHINTKNISNQKEHNFIKRNAIYIQEGFFAICEILLTIFVVALEVLHEKRSINPWLYAFVITTIKLTILTIIIRALNINLDENKETKELLKLIQCKCNETSNQLPRKEDVINNMTISKCNKCNKRVIKKNEENISINITNTKMRYKYSLGTVWGCQFLYMTLGVTGMLLYEYQHINIVTYVAVNIIAFMFGILTMSVFRFIITLNYQDNMNENKSIKKILENDDNPHQLNGVNAWKEGGGKVTI